MQRVLYGLGGFDPSKKNDNVIESVESADDVSPLAQAVETLQAVVDPNVANPSVQDQLTAIATILCGA